MTRPSQQTRNHLVGGLSARPGKRPATAKQKKNLTNMMCGGVIKAEVSADNPKAPAFEKLDTRKREFAHLRSATWRRHAIVTCTGNDGR